MIPEDTCTPMFIAALLTNARIQKPPKRPLTEECIRKVWHMYIYAIYIHIYIYREKEMRTRSRVLA